MNTYDSYAAAKIAMPGMEVFYSDKVKHFESAKENGEIGRCGPFLDLKIWTKCNPADHCSTLAEFLASGYELSKGDRIVDIDGNFNEVMLADLEWANKPHRQTDHKIFILSAAAIGGGSKIPEKKESEVADIDFEFGRKIGATHYCVNIKLITWYRKDGDCWDYTHIDHNYEWFNCAVDIPAGVPIPIPAKPKRTKVEYVPVTFESTIGNVDGDVMIESDLYFQWSESNVVPVSEVTGRDLIMNRHKLVRRIETEISERDEWIEAAIAAGDLNDTPANRKMLGKVYDAGLAFNPNGN
ncbi:hypothetical protein NVP1123O_71 [Vibrio phage 1.123.O._10N.286.48.F3]|nr:hypothetical protein NVP1123O_71 [Vibrio phage 1.123.O._10N.286.48.F3]